MKMRTLNHRPERSLRPGALLPAGSEDDHSTLVLLVVRIIAAIIIAILAEALIRGNTGVRGVFEPIVSEARYHRAKFYDHALYVASILIGLSALAWPRQRYFSKPWFKSAAVVVATIGLSIGIFAVEEPKLVISQGRWGGFGPGEFLAVSVLTLIIWKLFRWTLLPRWVRRTLTVMIVAISLGDLATIYQPSFMVGTWGFNDSYIINDILAQAAGKVPNNAYIPQYESILGWLIKPFSSFMSVATLTALITQLLAVVSLAGLFCGVLLVYRLFNRRSIALALLFVIPLTCVSVANNPLHNTLGGYQELPVRIAPPIILAALTLEDLLRLRARRSRPWYLALEGAIAAIVIWSNQDFCLVAVLTMVLLFLMSSTRKFGGPRGTAPWFIGFLAALSAYPLILWLAGNPVSPRTLFFFQTLFGKQGYLNYPIQIPGPVLLVLPICVATAIAGLFRMRRIWTPASGGASDLMADRAALTAAFFGVFSTLSLSYYVAQSVATGPLEALLTPIGIALAALVVLVSPRSEQYEAGGMQVVEAIRANGLIIPLVPACVAAGAVYFFSHSLLGLLSGLVVGIVFAGLIRLYWTGSHDRLVIKAKGRSWVEWLTVLPLTIAFLIPVAGLVQTPNPVEAVRDLIHPPPHSSIVWPSTAGVVSARKFAHREDLSLQYFGGFGNYMQLASGVRSVVLVNAPPADPNDRKRNSLDCQYIAEHPSSLLVVDVGTSQLYGQSICGRYRRSSNELASPYVLYATSAATHQVDAEYNEG